MSGGFFSAPELARTRAPLPLLPSCDACGLYKNCNSPMMPVDGEGQKEVLIVGEGPGCIAGDSLIEIAFRDKTKYPDGIPIMELVDKTGLLVYAFDLKKQQLVLGKVGKVWRTGTKATYRVTYEWWYADGRKRKRLTGSLVVSSNHQFLLKKPIAHDPFGNPNQNQGYLSIDEGLSVGYAIQPFHRRTYEYAHVGAFAKETVKESRFLLSYKLGRKLAADEECHHIDEHKHNDTWDNLELQTTSSHALLHARNMNPMDRPGVKERHAEVMHSDEYREGMSATMKEVFQNPAAYQKRLEEIESYKHKIAATVKGKYRDPLYYYRYLLGRAKCLAACTDEWVERRFRERFPNEVFPPNDNHRIIAIEYVGTQDVYDMEVEKYHNFAVNGIFVHNSNEDREGRPFIGDAGQHLQGVLNQFGVDMRRDCWITNSLICHPKDKEGNNRTPNDKEISYCRPNVVKAIQTLNPRTIILLGTPAVKSVIGWLWKEDPGGISRWAGWRVPCTKPNSWICPTFHPSFIIRSHDRVLDYYFARHLKRAFAKKRRPWKTPPDYRSMVRTIMDPNEGAAEVRKMIQAGKPVAFDVENDCLKPDGDGKIVCCSVSDGIISVAFPWHGDAIQAVLELAKSDVPKRGWNVQHEIRWLLAKHGVRVRNWEWDGMNNAHIMDNREGISGLKFQAFALVGAPSWDDAMKPYLKGRGGYGKNRIWEIWKQDPRAVLSYCGLDSLYEFRAAEVQMKHAKL